MSKLAVVRRGYRRYG